MRKSILAAGAAIVAMAMPALAQNQGQGQGGGQGDAGQTEVPVSPNADARASGQVQADVRAGTDMRANARAQERTGAGIDRTPMDEVDDGTDSGDSPDVDDTPDVDGTPEVVNPPADGADGQTPRYGGEACPPGLADRDPACIPPGQASKTFEMGERLPDNYRYYVDFEGIPETHRDRVPEQYRTDDFRYVYQGDRIYVVNRADSLVAAILDLVD